MFFPRSKTIPDPGIGADQRGDGTDDPDRAKVETDVRRSEGRPPPERSLRPSTACKGCYTVFGRRREDRVVCGTRVFEKDGCAVELSLVVDGHGGELVAEFLSREIPQLIRLRCEEKRDILGADFRPKPLWASILKQAFESCSKRWDENANTQVEKRAGAVATLVLTSGRRGLIAHVGDGRVVVSSGEAYRTLTRDHRASDEIERLRVESNGGFVANNRVKGVLAPSRAFGDILVRLNSDGTINNDIIRPDPDLIAFDLQRPGFMILGTDGLFDVVTDASAATAVSVFMANNADPTSAAKYLAEHAAKLTEDDVSVVVAMWP